MTTVTLRRLIFWLLLPIGFALVAAGDDNDPPPAAEFRASWEQFALVKPTFDEDGRLLSARLPLNVNPVVNAKGYYDGFRFVVPHRPGLDLVWAFFVPSNLRSWSILARDGQAVRFTHFWPKIRAQNEKIIYQPLDSQALVPGAEYMIWFRFTNGTPVELNLWLNFARQSASVSGEEEVAYMQQVLNTSDL
jgi:hypothetical protein